MSVSITVIELTEEITSALDKKKYYIGVFIDLNKSIRHNRPQFATAQIKSLLDMPHDTDYPYPIRIFAVF